MLRYFVIFMLLGVFLPISSVYADAMHVIVDLPITSNIITADPALASGTLNLTAAQNLYVGLTDIDPLTGTLKPELATRWEVSADGLMWTFTLREDVWWVRYDPVTTIFEQIRPIT